MLDRKTLTKKNTAFLLFAALSAVQFIPNAVPGKEREFIPNAVPGRHNIQFLKNSED